MLDETDKKIIAALQSDIPLESDPYRLLAKEIGISREELLIRLESQLKAGIMRRMGVVLRHREVGYAANALSVWRVPENRLREVADIMAAEYAVTHCYARRTAEGWPYNLYAMLHGRSRADCEQLAVKLAEAAKVDDYKLLFSTRELKKSSMKYFSE